VRSFTALNILSKSLHGSRVHLGAQNLHWDAYGVTGEISGPMLKLAHYVIIGHSERRQYFGDDASLTCAESRPTLWHHSEFCVGETKFNGMR